jgi:TM2 domain-containing membrane protein YozV
MDEAEIMEIKDSAKIMDQAQKTLYYEQKKKNPGLAAVASFIIPGLGQIWLGRIGRGIIILLLSWLIIPWLYGIYDAHNIAKEYNLMLYDLIYKSQDTAIQVT